MFNRIITSNMEIESINKYTSGVWRGILVGIILMFGARFADNCIVSERIAIELKNKIPPL